MARRLFNGRAFSENGWPYVDEGSCQWVDIPGANASLQIQVGIPLAVMRAFAADYNAYVEPVFDPDSACWTSGNSVATSNHPGGTAMDLRWVSHPFQVRGTFTPAQQATINELLDFYEGMIYWGGRWGSPVDEMHWQMGYDTYDQANDRPFPKCQDFVARKIRADGLSTFRRGTAAQPGDPALVLSRATGLDLNRAQEILPTMQDGLRKADCTTPLRIAMFVAQTGHESADFKATEEYQNGPMDQERWIYKGRTWIQLTWKSAYAGFGQWCYERGLVSDPNVFVNNPKSLADLKWAGLGAAYYWTTTVRPTRKYPTLNEASDAGDLETATLIINGGTNGIDDRRIRYNRALAVGDALLALLTGEDDDLSDPQIQQMIREIHACWFNQIPSASIYATPSEGPKWQLHELVKNDDAMAHQRDVEEQAKAGDLNELARVVRTAQGQGINREPWAIQRAQRCLTEIEATKPEILQRYLTQRGPL